MTTSTITGYTTGPYTLENSDSLTITSTGEIVGTTSLYAVEGESSIGTLANDGLIFGGIFVENAIGSLTNQGTISGQIGITDHIALYAGSIGTLTNSGVISGGQDAINDEGSLTSLSNDQGGSITASGTAIYVEAGIGTLTNAGTISSSTLAINASTLTSLNNESGGFIEGKTAISVSGSIGMLTNTGTIISSGNNGDAVSAGSIGTLTNAGTISGASTGINVDGTITSLNNETGGTITGTQFGLLAHGIGTLTNEGLISSNFAAINVGGTASIANSGTISGRVGIQAGTLNSLNNETGGVIQANSAIAVSGAIGTLTNEGTISGTGFLPAIFVQSGSIETLTNSGTIEGATSAYAHAIGSEGIGTLTNSGLMEAGGGALDIFGAVTELSNTGTISGTAGAIIASTLTSVDNEVGGRITASGTAIYGSQGIGTLTNAGTISSTNTFAIKAPTLTSLDNESGGLIEGKTAISVSGSIEMLTNTGTISASYSKGDALSAGSIGTLTNEGTITGGQYGIYGTGTFSSLDNGTAGFIHGVLAIDAGTIESLTNQGTISATFDPQTQDYAVKASLIGTLTNSGSITGGGNGDAIYATTLDTLNNNAGGIITAGYSAISGANGIGTLTNAGTISASYDCAINTPTLTSLDNKAGGLIESEYNSGVQVSESLGTLTNAGTISGSSFFGCGIYAGSIGTLTNTGVIEGGIGIYVVGSASITNAGTISGSGQAISVAGTASTLTIDPTSVITGTVADTVGDGTLVLGGSGAETSTGIGTQYTGFSTISFDNADADAEGSIAGLANGQTITGFTAGASITLDGFSATVGTYIAGTGLILTDANSATETLDITGTYSANDFTISTDTPGDTTVTEDVPCYLRGTRILTERGQVPVESLREGDLVATFNGQGAPFKPVTWIGHTRFDSTRHPHPEQVWPVRIRKDALAEGVPMRDLLVSPGHSLLIDGVLMQAERLLNGATILRDRSIAQGSYFHVELPGHDIILGEGLPAESYLDTGNRQRFGNGAGFVDLHPDFSAKHWSDTCRELVMSGERLVSARARLLARARALGHGTTQDPGVRLLSARGEAVLPASVRGRRYRFDLPEAGYFRLASRRWVPAEHLPDSTDRRELGVRVFGIQVGRDEREIAVESDALPAEGWHRPEGRDGNRWRWTTGLACLPWAAETITIELVSGVAYWATDTVLHPDQKPAAAA